MNLTTNLLPIPRIDAGKSSITFIGNPGAGEEGRVPTKHIGGDSAR